MEKYKLIAEEILEEYVNAYSEVDLKYVAKMLKGIVQDTAKEIYTQVLEWIPICKGYGKFIDNFESWLKEHYNVEIE